MARFARNDDARIVYTSGEGPEESPPQGSTGESSAADGDGVVRILRDKKGRKGKTMTLITGVPLPPAELKALAKAFKARCGSGGAVKPDGTIEIQGDHRETLFAELEKRGYQVKRSGG